MGFYEILILGARVAQLVFALIVLGTTAYAASAVRPISFNTINFNIFVSVWSLLIVGYQIFVPRFSEAAGHKFIILGLDAITALFWFAAFIALAVLASYYSIYDGYYFDGINDEGAYRTWYHTMQAGAAFGAFSWIAFMITTVMSGINVFRGNTGSAKHTHNPEISHSVA